MFKGLIRANMEVYLVDLLVKTRKDGCRIEDLRQAFEIMKRYRPKLNQLSAPSKFILENHGLLARHQGKPNKIKVLQDIVALNIRDVQSATRSILSGMKNARMPSLD